jgi:hypothetical protein
LTNDDNNKIVTRNVLLDGPYNTFPAPPSPPTTVYVMPLAPISTFGGTSYWLQPNPDVEFAATGTGLAWSYGWTYDTGPHVTFPEGSHFVESMIGGLKKYNGAAFVDAPGGAQLEAHKSATNFAVSGPGAHSISLKDLVAPTSPMDTTHLDDHTAVQWQLLGDGIVPDATHPPAFVADGTYMIQLGLSLAGQPAGSSIEDSDPYYFVMYKGVSADEALAAATLAFPGAAIQVVPEPAMLGGVAMGLVALIRRRAR